MAARPDDADEPVEEPVLGEPVDPAAGREPEPAASRGDDAPDPSAAPDVEAQWADIVARLSDVDLAAESVAEPGAEPGPTQGGAGRPEGRQHRGDDADDLPPGRTIRPARRVEDPRSWLPDPALEEAEDHFDPPDPGPVLGGDPLLTMAWTVVVGVPVLLIVVVVLGREMPGAVLATAGALLAAAVGLLLWRMPHGDDEDDHSGPGAVV